VCTHEQMRLGTAAYWLSLRDRELQPAGAGHPRTTVVELPLANLLTVESLGGLLGAALEGAAR
jgi:hypothetical protein